MDHDMGRAAMVYPHETECSLGQTRRRRLLARLRHAAMFAVRSLSGEKRTFRGHRVSAANDPSRSLLGRPGAFSVSATDDGVENCQFCLLNG